MSNLTDLPAGQPNPNVPNLPAARLVALAQLMAPLGRDSVSTHVSTGLQPANRTTRGGVNSLS